MKLLLGSILIFAVNLPFGYWRVKTKRFSAPWVLAVHLPVPFVVAVRIIGGLGWQFVTFPILVGAYFSGQWVGGRLRSSRTNDESTET